IQQAIVQLTECEQQIKWTNSPKIFVEITLLTITNRHNKSEQNIEETQISNAEVKALTDRINLLEKKLNEVGKSQNSAQDSPTSRNREKPRAKKRTYDIPHERIRMVLSQAEKSA